MTAIIIVKQVEGVDPVRLTSDQTKQNRQIILETASRLFRLHGIEEVSVAEIMKECGFTHGGFYNHFASKEELAAEAITCAFQKSVHVLSKKITPAGRPQKGLERLIMEYLSPAYRDSSTGGCPAAALPAEAARNSKDVQSHFAEGIESYLQTFANGMDGSNRETREKSIALLSSLVGALILSRAVKKSNPKLSDELLISTRVQLLK
jgi:TetR/AcrR family transcriptional regulator, transcriptional repressor for nem operon